MSMSQQDGFKDTNQDHVTNFFIMLHNYLLKI